MSTECDILEHIIFLFHPLGFGAEASDKTTGVLLEKLFQQHPAETATELLLKQLCEVLQKGALVDSPEVEVLLQAMENLPSPGDEGEEEMISDAIDLRGFVEMSLWVLDPDEEDESIIHQDWGANSEESALLKGAIEAYIYQ